MKFIITLWIAKLVAFAVNIIDKKRGSNYSGKIAVKLMSNFVSRFRNIDYDKVIFVSGTNGKSTTTNLIYHTLRSAGVSVASNTEGANMMGGVATTLIKNSTLSGRFNKEYLVLEIDERSFPLIRKQLPGRRMGLTNLQKDQVQRNGDPDFILRKFCSAVSNDMKLMDVLSGFSEDDSILVEGFCFLVTGVLLLVSTYIGKRKTLKDEVGPKSAIAIGLAQVFAAGFPGISRSGSTISTGMVFGVSKETMVEYSFVLGIPAILVANIVEFKDAIDVGAQLEVLPTIIGIIVAAVSGVACIKLLQWILKKDMWKYFGFYCLLLGAVVLICSFFGI